MNYSKYAFGLINTDTLKELAKGKTLLPYKKVDGKKDERWNTKLITSKVMQGMISGSTIPDIAKSFRDVMEMNKASSYRNARTSITSCENSARMKAMERAEDMGIKMKKQWMATHDDRTRDSHLALDGETVDIHDKFSNGLMEPADPNGDPEEVYNCRCTMITVVDGVDPKVFNPNAYEPDEDGDVYEERLAEMDGKAESEYKILNDSWGGIVEGKDISETWTRRADQFDFEIEDVINAQGFDGTPRVVSAEDFDKAVEESGFIAQRTYSAPDQETLDMYRDMLYNGKWYVDCSTGGAQYGQGMYCAANYNGELTDGIKAEMKHYQDLAQGRGYENDIKRNYVEKELKQYDENTQAVIRVINDFNATEKHYVIMDELSGNELKEARRIAANIQIESERLAKQFIAPVSYTETLTLAPDAKIISYNDLLKLYDKKEDDFIKASMSKWYKDEVGKLGFSKDSSENIIKALNEYEDMMSALTSGTLNNEEFSAWSSIHDHYDRERVLRLEEFREMDKGSFAVKLGYDAINAEGHGESGSYTVILNRTKVIFKEDKH